MHKCRITCHWGGVLAVVVKSCSSAPQAWGWRGYVPPAAGCQARFGSPQRARRVVTPTASRGPLARSHSASASRTPRSCRAPPPRTSAPRACRRRGPWRAAARLWWTTRWWWSRRLRRWTPSCSASGTASTWTAAARSTATSCATCCRCSPAARPHVTTRPRRRLLLARRRRAAEAAQTQCVRDCLLGRRHNVHLHLLLLQALGKPTSENALAEAMDEMDADGSGLVALRGLPPQHKSERGGGGASCVLRCLYRCNARHRHTQCESKCTVILLLSSQTPRP